MGEAGDILIGIADVHTLVAQVNSLPFPTLDAILELLQKDNLLLHPYFIGDAGTVFLKSTIQVLQVLVASDVKYGKTIPKSTDTAGWHKVFRLFLTEHKEEYQRRVRFFYPEQAEAILTNYDELISAFSGTSYKRPRANLVDEWALLSCLPGSRSIWIGDSTNVHALRYFQNGHRESECFYYSEFLLIDASQIILHSTQGYGVQSIINLRQKIEAATRNLADRLARYFFPSMDDG